MLDEAVKLKALNLVEPITAGNYDLAFRRTIGIKAMSISPPP